MWCIMLVVLNLLVSSALYTCVVLDRGSSLAKTLQQELLHVGAAERLRVDCCRVTSIGRTVGVAQFEAGRGEALRGDSGDETS